MPFIPAGATLRVNLPTGSSLIVNSETAAGVTYVSNGAPIPGVSVPFIGSRATLHGPVPINGDVIVAAAASVEYEVIVGDVNQITPATVTTLTAGQIALPSLRVIADTRTTYQLDVLPHTRYQSNGVSLIAIGSSGGPIDGGSASVAPAPVQLRRDTGANWTSLNPILALGEVGVNSTTGQIKVGDGVTTWALLSYLIGAGGGGYTSIAFNAAIKFDNDYTMGLKIVVAPIAFTLDAMGLLPDKETVVTLRADGTNAPTFAPFRLVGSQAYSNTLNQENDVAFFTGPTGMPYYGVVLGDVFDGVAPTLVSAVVANATPTIINLTFSEAINSTMPPFGSFAVSAGHALTAIAYVDATHVNLTTSAAFVFGEAARTLAYTQGTNPIKDLARTPNLLANITAAAITNNVSSAGFADNFNRADNALTLGAPWVPEGVAVWGISGNQAYQVGSDTFSRNLVTHTTADTTLSCDVTTRASYSYALIFRGVNSTNYYLVEIRSAGFDISKVVANVGTSLFTSAAGQYADDVQFNLQIVLAGTSITLKNNGVTLTTLTDATFSGLKFGIGVWATAGAAHRFDNFSLTP